MTGLGRPARDLAGAQVALFGGTFDPPHSHHVAVADAAKAHLPVDQVWLLPAGDPYMKPGATSAAQRMHMCQLLTAGRPWLHVSDVEVRRAEAGPTYTADTLELLAAAHPRTTFWWVCGADSFAAMPTWGRADRIAELARMAVMPRDGWPHPCRADVVLPPVGGQSSTAVRHSIAAGEDPTALLPGPVGRYVRAHGLYRHPAPVHA